MIKKILANAIYRKWRKLITVVSNENIPGVEINQEDLDEEEIVRSFDLENKSYANYLSMLLSKELVRALIVSKLDQSSLGGIIKSGRISKKVRASAISERISAELKAWVQSDFYLPGRRQIELDNDDPSYNIGLYIMKHTGESELDLKDLMAYLKREIFDSPVYWIKNFNRNTLKLLQKLCTKYPAQFEAAKQQQIEIQLKPEKDMITKLQRLSTNHPKMLEGVKRHQNEMLLKPEIYIDACSFFGLQKHGGGCKRQNIRANWIVEAFDLETYTKLHRLASSGRGLEYLEKFLNSDKFRDIEERLMEREHWEDLNEEIRLSKLPRIQRTSGHFG